MFPAMIIVPLMQIAWSLFSIVSGMIYFQEYKTFTTLSACMFGLGVVVSTVVLRGSAATCVRCIACAFEHQPV